MRSEIVVARPRREPQLASAHLRSIVDGTPIAERDPSIGGISSRLAELGYAQAEIEENLRVRPPTPDEARFLRMTPDQRVIEIFHIGWTATNQAVKINVYILPSFQWNLRYRYPIDPV